MQTSSLLDLISHRPTRGAGTKLQRLHELVYQLGFKPSTKNSAHTRDQPLSPLGVPGVELLKQSHSSLAALKFVVVVVVRFLYGIADLHHGLYN